MGMRGARYLHVLVTCPLGWGTRVVRLDPDRAAGHADRAVPGLRGRARRRHRGHEDPPPRRRSRTTCARRSASATSSSPSRATDVHRAHPGPRRPQHPTLRTAADGQALRDHARRRLEPRQQDRLLAHRAAGLRAQRRALRRRLPGRRGPAGLALPRRGGRLRGAPGARSWTSTRCPRSWAASVTTRARPPATACSSTRRSASTPSSASSATRRSATAGRVAPHAPPTGKRVLVVGAGPSGLSAAYHLARLGHTVEIHDAGPARRRHDALRHPALPAPARRPRRRDRSASSTSA